MSVPSFGSFLSRTGGSVVGKRDEVYADVPLGVIPAEPNAPVRASTEADVTAPVAVRFEPPQGIAPEQVGWLRFADLKGSDLAAALIGLAVDRQISIERHEEPRRVGKPKTTWTFDLHPSAQRPKTFLRGQIFDAVKEAFPRDLPGVKKQVAADFSSLRLTVSRDALNRAWYPKIKTGGTFGLGGAKVRSARGTALRYQLAGFLEFLATADGARLRFEEGADIFSWFLPWAIALGVAKQWAAALEEAAQDLDDTYASVWANDLAWMGGLDLTLDGFDLGAFVGDFAGDIGDLAGDLSGGDGGSFGGDGGGGDGGGGGG
ncbi:MAG: DUF2207 domain-containing protein, partial [Propionibacteriaceae bacterium]|nr:DUF2207 domain-containing protein [Propionibacteriaceae bacterium]